MSYQEISHHSPAITAKLAAIISLICSPSIVPIITILLLVRVYAQTWEQFALWALICVIFATVLPTLYIYTLVKKGKLSDMHIAIREQRAGPLLFAVISALVGVSIIYVIGAPIEIFWLGICYVANGIVFLLITQFWKISLHCGVLSACVTALSLIITPQLFFLYLLVPLVAWARIHRKRHTFIQSIAGAIIAVIVTKLTLLAGK